MPVYFARPANVANPPVILVCMEIFGLHEWVKDIPAASAISARSDCADHHFRRKKRHRSDQDHDMAKLIPIVNAKTDTELFADLDATVAWAKAQGGDPTSSASWASAAAAVTCGTTRRTIRTSKAGVAFYGSLIDKSDAAPKNSIELAPEVKSPYSAFTAKPNRHHAGSGQADGGRRKPPARPRNSTRSPARRTALSPITGRATARRRPRTPGTR